MTIFELRRLFHPVKPFPEIEHLPFSIGDAIRHTIRNKEINEKLKKGYFKKHFIYVTALPKSASSIIGFCIAEISGCGSGKRSYARYMKANQDSDIRPEIVRDFPEGGIVKFHTRATGKNLKALEFLGIKYFILLRHPADQLIAAYCQCIFDDESIKKATEKKYLLYDYIYPLDYKFFQPDIDINDTIGYMINGGYLNAVLSWIVDWSRLRNPRRSFILKYEDFVLGKNKMLNDISYFLHNRDLDADMKSKCNSIADKYTDSRLKAEEQQKYPRGWTGKINIWKEYFSDRNREDYLSVTKRFLNYYPDASLLLDFYPDLLLE